MTGTLVQKEDRPLNLELGMLNSLGMHRLLRSFLARGCLSEYLLCSR